MWLARPHIWSILPYVDKPQVNISQPMTYKESYEAFSKRFRKNLKKSLEQAGMTQRQQTLAGLDPRYIARIKNGDGNPTLMTIWRICKAAGIEPGELFGK